MIGQPIGWTARQLWLPFCFGVLRKDSPIPFVNIRLARRDREKCPFRFLWLGKGGEPITRICKRCERLWLRGGSTDEVCFDTQPSALASGYGLLGLIFDFCIKNV